MNIREIELSELPKLIRRDPCLVFGPGATTYSTLEDDLYQALHQKHQLKVASSRWHELADEISVQHSIDLQDIRAAVSSFFQQNRPEGPDTEAIGKISWRAIVSLSYDLLLHKRIKERLDHEPTSWQVTTIADPSPYTQPNTIPYYALMGDLRETIPNKRICVSESEYLTRKRLWPKMLSSLGDFAKDDPLIFLGTGNITERVIDFIDVLLSLYPRCPSRFIFQKSDITVKSAKLRNLVGEMAEIILIDASTREIAKTAAREHRELYDLPIFSFRGNGPIADEELKPVSDYCTPVPPKTALNANPAERRKNLNSLFQSASLDWAPFELKLNFKRDYESILTSYIDEQWSASPKILEISGEAGCGKSVAIKSIAYELTNKGYLVLWLKRGFGESSGNNLLLLSNAISKAVQKPSVRVLVVIDDPIACGFDPSEVTSVLKGLTAIEWRVLACRRKSDLIGRATGLTPANPLPEFPERFSQEEWNKLPDYLVSIGVSLTTDDAKRDLARVPSSAGSDVLCALWYLLPQTRDILSNSLSNEYFRLGGLEHTIEFIARSVSNSETAIVKQAYEFVTVCAGLDRTPVPVEVLVGALGVTYQAWTSQCDRNKPVWGLLTEEYDRGADTYVYRNRNAVVTTVLMRLINGPDGSHAGEFRILKQLIGACVSSKPQYVQFIKWILVERRESLEERLNLDQITDLYDTALNACPIKLGIVQHHRAIARSRKGASQLAVHNELLEVLKNAGSVRGENDDAAENIHSSAAAFLVKSIETGESDPISVSQRIFSHIDKALGSNRINWHAYHIHARSLKELATLTKTTAPEFASKCFLQATQITERALSLLDPVTGTHGRFVNDREFFRNVRNDIVQAAGDLRDLKQHAEFVFAQSADQSAYVLCAKIMSLAAARDENNAEYKKVDDYIRLICSRITNAGQVPEHTLTATRIENEFRWKLVKGSTTKYDLAAAWRDTRVLLGVEVYARDVMWNFMAAVLAFLCKEHAESDALFTNLRKMSINPELKTVVRCYARNERGNVHVFEGRVTNATPPRIFIYTPELETDVLGFISEFGADDGKPVHFQLGFTTNGAIACKPLNRS